MKKTSLFVILAVVMGLLLFSTLAVADDLAYEFRHYGGLDEEVQNYQHEGTPYVNSMILYRAYSNLQAYRSSQYSWTYEGLQRNRQLITEPTSQTQGILGN